MWVRSGVQTLRSDVSRLVFLGKVGLGVQKLGHCCALKLWKGSGQEPGEDKGFGSGCNVLVASGWHGRIPGYLAYRRRAKWNLVESATHSPPTDRVLSDPSRCSSSKHLRGKGKVSV